MPLLPPKKVQSEATVNAASSVTGSKVVATTLGSSGALGGALLALGGWLNKDAAAIYTGVSGAAVAVLGTLASHVALAGHDVDHEIAKYSPMVTALGAEAVKIDPGLAPYVNAGEADLTKLQAQLDGAASTADAALAKANEVAANTGSDYDRVKTLVVQALRDLGGPS